MVRNQHSRGGEVSSDAVWDEETEVCQHHRSSGLAVWIWVCPQEWCVSLKIKIRSLLRLCCSKLGLVRCVHWKYKLFQIMGLLELSCVGLNCLWHDTFKKSLVVCTVQSAKTEYTQCKWFWRFFQHTFHPKRAYLTDGSQLMDWNLTGMFIQYTQPASVHAHTYAHAQTHVHVYIIVNEV